MELIKSNDWNLEWIANVMIDNGQRALGPLGSLAVARLVDGLAACYLIS